MKSAREGGGSTSLCSVSDLQKQVGSLFLFVQDVHFTVSQHKPFKRGNSSCICVVYW